MPKLDVDVALRAIIEQMADLTSNPLVTAEERKLAKAIALLAAVVGQERKK